MTQASQQNQQDTTSPAPATPEVIGPGPASGASKPAKTDQAAVNPSAPEDANTTPGSTSIK